MQVVLKFQEHVLAFVKNMVLTACYLNFITAVVGASSGHWRAAETSSLFELNSRSQSSCHGLECQVRNLFLFFSCRQRSYFFLFIQMVKETGVNFMCTHVRRSVCIGLYSCGFHCSDWWKICFPCFPLFYAILKSPQGFFTRILPGRGIEVGGAYTIGAGICKSFNYLFLLNINYNKCIKQYK